MSERSHGRAVTPSSTAAAGESADRLPPSTLAAQLVENISASAKSSRSDDGNELKRLFAVIQRVKDQPGLLKTTSEKIEHNHMLIYVYCRVALHGIRLDDPFINQSRVHSELLKAVKFLRFSIKETPQVLASVDDASAYVHRGAGPLWAWLLPHLFRILGHAKCTELEGPIEGLVQYVLLLVFRNNALGDQRASLSLYLRACLLGLLEILQDSSLVSPKTDTPIGLRLPPLFALDQIFGDTRLQSVQEYVYTVGFVGQAVRQALSLARMLAYSFISQDSLLSSAPPLSQNGPLMMDSWLDLRLAQRRLGTGVESSPVTLMETALHVVKFTATDAEVLPSLRSKANTLLVLLCSEVISSSNTLMEMSPEGDQSRLVFCKALLAVSEASLQSYATGRLALSKLVPELMLLSMQHPPIGEDTDFGRCVRLLRDVVHLSAGETLENEGIHPSKFENQEIRELVGALSLTFAESLRGASLSPKRRKVSVGEVDLLESLTRAILEALQVEPPGEGASMGFEALFLNGFEKSCEEGQCLSIELLSRIGCIADGFGSTPKFTPHNSVSQSSELQCGICDESSADDKPPIAHSLKSEARRIFSKLVNLPKFLESRRPRIVAMIALRRLVYHCEDRGFLDLDNSELADPAALTPGRWCLQSLINSSVRELRVAAGRTLATFMPQRPIRALDQDLLCRNRKCSITILKESSETNQPQLVETRILAWAQLGRVVTEDELNLVLIKLLEYLGSNNSIVSAFAFNELLNLAESRDMTPRRLFEPFWKNLAYMVTKDMVHRPQRSRAIAELLQISANELLLLIQSHALPWLVLEDRQDVIQKIADARQEKETWHALTDGPNLATILALLLVQEQNPASMAEFTKSRLSAASPHFQRLTLLDLFQSEPVLTALELLRAATTADAQRQQVVHNALHLMATTLLSANKDVKTRRSNVIGQFLQTHVLGIMARLTDVINDSVSSHPPVMEQRSCIRTLEQMIKYCKSYARIARPQISACLLSALPQDSLREASFSCWAAMLTNLEEDDVEALIEATFFIINRYWTVFSDSAKGAAKDMLSSLLEKHKNIVKAYIRRLPSLSHMTGLADVESRLSALRPVLTTDEALHVFAERVAHDNSGVVHQALTELAPYLREQQKALYMSAVSQRPDSAITCIMRALLDCACKNNGVQLEISRLCVECIGLIGCLDSNRIETIREQRSIVVLSNFEGIGEATDFGLFLLQEVLVPSFLSAADTKLQGFLSYAIQEILVRCDVRAACAMQNTGMLGGNDIYRKWIALPETVREVVTPFLTSRYVVAPMAPVTVQYPVFHPGKPYVNWLRPLVIDLLQHGQNDQAETLFEPLTRVIRVKDLSTAEFLLPYLVLHVLLGNRSTKEEKDRTVGELMAILSHRPEGNASYVEKEEMKRYCHAVFRVIDYAMRWIQAKRSSGRLSSTGEEAVSRIQKILAEIPAELISQRAVDYGDYARALFHLEQHAQGIDQSKTEGQPGDRSRLLEQLQDIYANIDEPDGLEGISAQMHALDINQQILSHKKAGRWTAAQTWYEIQLAEKPESVDLHLEMLHCLRQAGQYDALLNHVEGSQTGIAVDNKVMPFAVEAAWVTGRWDRLAKFTSRFRGDVVQDFNISVAALFDSLYRKKRANKSFTTLIKSIRDRIASEMTASSTTSLQAAHHLLLKCHVLTDLEIIVGLESMEEKQRGETMDLLGGRFEVMGAFYHDRQYLLGIRRAAMELKRPMYGDADVSSLWLSSARLARKTDSLHQSFNAVLHASQLGDDAATIENTKLLWRDNHHRKAIQMLQGAIERNKLMTQTSGPSSSTGGMKLSQQQKLVVARAQLLLAKWLDAAGQSHAGALRERFQQPPRSHPTWEKGHYYLGRHYKKILEAEGALKADDQGDNVVTGEVARLVIENYLRSLHHGTKYLYQTLPRVLTLWMELGAQVDKAPEGKVSLSRELHRSRLQQFSLLHTFLDKYIQRIPAYVFYTALPQVVARIAHPNTNVFDRLTHIIVKVVETHPRQALWSLIGIMTSKQASERKARGRQIVQALRGISGKVEGLRLDLKQLLRAGEKLAEELLLACHNGEFPGNKTTRASLTRDLHFNHKCTPCPLAVPVEAQLMATLPTVSEQGKKHQAFSRDVVTLDCFLDEVLVLSSLAKPRRLTARGSDGKSYMLLIKPKDDLRTDQRLMEFNGIINRSLKRDAEASRRQLYIRTYAVVPLNEECGIIEWVPGIRTMRDILLSNYAARKIQPDYNALKCMMEEASTSESKLRIFTEDVLGRFPAVLPAWFVQQFPSPSSWLAARLRYTRSCAVMSMVGTMLGLGDRHGENVNLEEGNGGVFHVDFNCLFDKGRTFLKPERVPFRLTHNMVAAMGLYGYEGPFRKSSELTLSNLRQQEETLMTILEAFIYDPTLDLQREKRSSAVRKGDGGGGGGGAASVIRLQPQSVVDSIKRKLRGLLPEETIPLSVEGQVEELIKQAVDPRNLTAMYIGWCPFL